MRMPRKVAAALVVAAFLAPRPGHAQTVVGLRTFGGYDTYAMGDADDIRRGLLIPSSQFSTPRDGWSLGVGAELAWRKSLSFTFSYQRLTPGRMCEVNKQKMKLPANVLLLEAEYRRRVRPRLQIGAGGGAGYYLLGQEVESPGTQRDFAGDAFGGQAFGLAEWDLTSATTFGLDIGYRWANVPVSEVNHRPPPSFGIDVDYSGLTTRLVLRYLPRRNR